MTDEDITKIMRDKELATCHEAFDTYGMEKNCGFLMTFGKSATERTASSLMVTTEKSNK